MKYSVKKISEMTGFSPATVSNALNKKKGVNRETSEQIWKTAREVGYVGNAKIAGIKFVICKKDGQVVSDTPFFSILMESVEAAGREAGFPTIISNVNLGGEDYEARLDEMRNDDSTGVLLLATELESRDMAAFETAVCPLVVLDAWFDNMKFDTVLANNEDSVSGATDYLVARGHRRIGYLSSSVRIRNFTHRGLGYRRAMRSRGLDIREAYRASLTPTMDGAYRDMCAYLEGPHELPTAYVADNDIIALGAMKALQQYGYRIPEDVSIIGFDDLPFCEISSPALTTIRFNQRELGRLAVERLVARIKDPDMICSKIQVSTRFIPRESVRDLDVE